DKMFEDLDSRQIDRLWEYRLHLINIFYNRLNFYLIFESVLLGIIGVLYSRPNPTTSVLRLLDFIGIAITIVWIYIMARQKYSLNILNKNMREVVPEYKVYREGIEKVKWPFSTVSLEAYLIPAIIALLWIAIILFL